MNECPHGAMGIRRCLCSDYHPLLERDLKHLEVWESQPNEGPNSNDSKLWCGLGMRVKLLGVMRGNETVKCQVYAPRRLAPGSVRSSSERLCRPDNTPGGGLELPLHPSRGFCGSVGLPISHDHSQGKCQLAIWEAQSDALLQSKQKMSSLLKGTVSFREMHQYHVYHLTGSLAFSMPTAAPTHV